MNADLSQTQSMFQSRLLSGATEIEAHLVDGGPFLKVYDRAYLARLLEVMAADFPGVHTLLGDDEFHQAASAYLNDHPSTERSIRWLGQHFEAWLKQTSPWRDLPLLADMAAFEWALGLAFDAADQAAIEIDDLASIPPDIWPKLQFDFHPALTTLSLTFDVAPFQQAIAREQEPDAAPSQFETAQTWAVWRDPSDLRGSYRPLSQEEALGLHTLRNGAPFAALCEILAEFGDADESAFRAAGYLRNWVETGWITGHSATMLSW